MFLLYINDIVNRIKSSIRLFTDDGLIYMYMTISFRDHCQQLQDDLTMYSSELDQKVSDDLQPIQVLFAADSEGEGSYLSV